MGSVVGHLRVHVGPGVRETVRQHTAIHSALEVGGILVGTSDGGVRVRAVIPAFSSAAPGAPLTVTSDAWESARAELSRYPGMEIVGWYRSRRHGQPRLGPETVEAQARYFAHRGQLLLLVGVPDSEEIWFAWDGETLARLGLRQLVQSLRTRGHRRGTRRGGGLRARQVACAATGVALGWAIWSVAIHTGDPPGPSASQSAASALRPRGGRPSAHPIVVEPSAGRPASGTP